MHETENYRRYIELCDQIIEGNEHICDLRGAMAINDEDGAEPLIKITVTPLQETQKEVNHTVSMAYKGGKICPANIIKVDSN